MRASFPITLCDVFPHMLSSSLNVAVKFFFFNSKKFAVIDKHLSVDNDFVDVVAICRVDEDLNWVAKGGADKKLDQE